MSFVIFPSAAYAQTEDLIINAEDVSYDKENSLVRARGSVEVVYKDVTVYGGDIVYNTKAETVQAEDGFLLCYNGISIEGRTLNYEIKKKLGVAGEVNFNYRSIRLGGKKISLGEEKFELKNASFSTCDLKQPHYKVTANDIIFYPKYGWLVAYWGYFWLGPFPVVPMPTYIYDMLAEEKAQKNLAPFPEIGSNDEDGTYVNERLAWHIRRELSGTYSLTYASKKGFGGGAEADYILNDASRGNLRLYGNAGDSYWGGWTHWLYFGDEITTDSNAALSFFHLPKQRRYELETIFSHRERINYQRVSFTPNVTFRSRKGSLCRPEALYDLELLLGDVREENNLRLARGGGKLTLYWDFPEITLGDITPSLGLDALYYSNGQKWIKTTGGLSLKKKLTANVLFGLGYLHYFSVEGQSPFLFELYRFRAADRVMSNLFFVIGETGIEIAASYFVDNWEAEDIDYALHLKAHCYNLIVRYRSLRREFELGFSLAGG